MGTDALQEARPEPTPVMPPIWPKRRLAGQRNDRTEKHWQNYIKPIRNNTETQMFNNFIPSDQTVGLIP